jgi:hypothetical protein
VKVGNQSPSLQFVTTHKPTVLNNYQFSIKTAAFCSFVCLIIRYLRNYLHIPLFSKDTALIGHTLMHLVLNYNTSSHKPTFLTYVSELRVEGDQCISPRILLLQNSNQIRLQNFSVWIAPYSIHTYNILTNLPTFTCKGMRRHSQQTGLAYAVRKP